MFFINSEKAKDEFGMQTRVESGSDDPDYPGHLGRFFCGSIGSHPQN